MPFSPLTYNLEHGAKVIFIIAPVVLFAYYAAGLLKFHGIKRAAAGLLIAFALVAAAGGFLGIIGRLSFPGFAVVLWPAVMAAWLIDRKRKPAGGDNHEKLELSLPKTTIIVGLIGLSVAAGHLAAKFSQPATVYDDLTYHLHFPAQWLLEKRMFIVDTPFGDAAPAYAPAGGEIWNAWLMAPMQGAVYDMGGFKFIGVEALAKVGQFPFLILLACALAMMIPRLAGDKCNYLPVALLPFVPWILRQSASASVDLMMGACLVSALAFILEYKDTGKNRDAALSGMAFGLAFGVKFIALVYALPLLIPTAFILIKRKNQKAWIAWGAPLLILGLPWYLRNLVVCGNPLFPVEVAVGPHIIFKGAYTREAMQSSLFHTPDFPSAVMVASHAFGIVLAPLALSSIAAGCVGMIRRPAWRYVAWIAPLAIVWHFVIVPYSSQDRFLIWAVALSFLPLAQTPQKKSLRTLLFAAVFVFIFLSVFGAGIDIKARGYTLPIRGVFTSPAIISAPATIGPALAAGAVAFLLRRGMRTMIAAAFAASCFTTLFFCTSIDGHFVRTSINNIRVMPVNGYARAWELWPRHIAYAGKNTPFYLVGRDGTSRVHYINVDGRDDWLMHDYVRELEAKGILDKSLDKDNWRRKEPDFEKWLAALKTPRRRLPVFTARFSRADQNGSIQRRRIHDRAILGADAPGNFYQNPGEKRPERLGAF